MQQISEIDQIELIKSINVSSLAAIKKYISSLIGFSENQWLEFSSSIKQNPSVHYPLFKIYAKARMLGVVCEEEDELLLETQFNSIFGKENLQRLGNSYDHELGINKEREKIVILFKSIKTNDHRLCLEHLINVIKDCLKLDVVSDKLDGDSYVPFMIYILKKIKNERGDPYVSCHDAKKLEAIFEIGQINGVDGYCITSFLSAIHFLNEQGQLYSQLHPDEVADFPEGYLEKIMQRQFALLFLKGVEKIRLAIQKIFSSLSTQEKLFLQSLDSRITTVHNRIVTFIASGGLTAPIVNRQINYIKDEINSLLSRKNTQTKKIRDLIEKISVSFNGQQLLPVPSEEIAFDISSSLQFGF